MKNFTFLALAVFSLFALPASAQQKLRCITEEKMQELFRTDPQARIRYENTRRMLDQKVAQYMSDANARLFRTQAIINIPVVVHIATSNPALVTDAIVQRQIDTLNWYYGGASNDDSLRVYTPFRTAYGRSQIRFCLAQRTPAGQATNGITRTTTSTIFASGGSHPSSVVPAWNTQQYMNIWVVQFSGGILGYSYKPGTFPPGDQRIGYVVDYRAFGSGASYLYTEYNQGKTGVHEIGHYFNLDHTWGPNNNGNPTCTLSDGCNDTPPTNGPFFGCPTSAPVTSTSCPATGPDGVMWQNHMDYADDRCMILFTKDQVTRMETALTTSPDRNTLLTSLGCQPLVAQANDAGITQVNAPANGSVTCSNTVTPTVTLRNYGSNALTSVNIIVTVNNIAQAPQAWTGNLAPNTTTTVTLSPVTLNPGANTISAATSQPNGAADGTPANDGSANITTNFASSTTLPLQEGFETAAFPPSGWSRINPNGDFTWLRTTPGRNGSAGAMWINNFDVDGTNNIDDFRSSPVSTAGVTTLQINFDVAHRYYGTSGAFWDTLTVLVSNDCGATYQTVYKKWGPQLGVASQTSSYLNPPAADWRTEQIAVTGPVLSGDVIVVFRNTSRYGNNIYIDNINIQKQSTRDLRLQSIDAPATTYCSSSVVPQVTVFNNGAEAISSFQVGYRIGTGPVLNKTFNVALNPGASTQVTLDPTPTTPGNRSITAFTFAPVSASGTGDINNANDTLSKNFTVVPLNNPPVVEGFELSFPSTGWSIINPNNNVTWIRRAPGRNSQNSAFIDNYNNNLNNQTDAIRTPYINVTGADSLLATFDLAHKNYPAAANSDTLNVLLSTDCGNTFTSVYRKWGSTLATAGSSTGDYTNPIASDWRNERIALGADATASGAVVLMWRNTNRYGNNVFLDNINITGVFKRDARVMSINSPQAILCNGAITPSVTVRNVGSEVITALKVSYSIDNGAPQTANLTGLTLLRDQQTNVNLPAANVTSTGAHTIRVYSWEPVTASGIGDMYTANDTLVKSFSLAGTVAAPLTENFSGTTFAPNGWSVANNDNGITWSRHGNGNGNAGSAFVNTYNYTTLGQRDELASPNVTYSGVDSVTLSFDLSAATYSYPGSTTVPMDTLEVLVSRDCGNTFTSVYKKWGEELQTINDPNYTNLDEYFPGGPATWRKETIDLTGLGANGPIMTFFRVTNNYENNIFIDNVNLTTRVLPTKIKQQGYLILPSPFQNSFGVWHLQTPSDLKYINVYNSIGQLIWTKSFNGNGTKMEMVDMTGKAAGVYIVKLGYNDENKNVSERVVKF